MSHFHGSHLQDMVDDLARDVDPGWFDAVTELGCVVDFVDEQAAVLRLEEVDRDNTATDGFRRGKRCGVELWSDRTVGRCTTAGRVGDPMRRRPIDGADCLIADDEAPDVTPGFLDILLDVEDRVLVTPECLLMLEECLGRVPIVDLGQETPPGTRERFQDDGVAHLLDRFER